LEKFIVSMDNIFGQLFLCKEQSKKYFLLGKHFQELFLVRRHCCSGQLLLLTTEQGFTKPEGQGSHHVVVNQHIITVHSVCTFTASKDYMV
jgi:hypothetical protein